MKDKKIIEISLKELFVVLLRKWWMILLGAILVFLISAAFSFVKTQRSIEELNRRYQANLNAYNQEIKDKEDTIQYLYKSRSANERYINNSILMQIDPLNVKVARMTIIVNAQDQTGEIRPEALDAINSTIAGTYISLAENAPWATLLSGKVSDQYLESYLRELVTVGETEEDKKEGKKEERFNFLKISALGNEEIDPAEILNVLYNYLEEQKENVTNSTMPHQLWALGPYVLIESDPELTITQSNKLKSLAAESSNISKLTNELNALRSNKPDDPSSILGFINDAALLALVSMMIIIFFIVADYIVSIRIQTDDQIQSQLGIRYLNGGLFKKGRLIGRWADGLSGMRRLASEKEVKDLVHTNIKEFVLGRYDQVLVTGTVTQDVLDDLSNELTQLCGECKTRFVAARDVANNAAAIEVLSHSQAVILAERMDVSKLKNVHRCIERVRQSDKDIIGYTLV